MKKLVIIGGGISGLAAAYKVQEKILSEGAAVECTVVEASPRFGGKICTQKQDGFLIERGPDSFISQKPWAIDLIKRLGLGDELMGTQPEHPKTFVYLNKRLRLMPDGLSLMIPTRFLPFIASRLFTWPGKIRMGLDLLIPRKCANGDESLASFVRRRLGEEALERMAQPMLAGIYAGDPEKMSINATFPNFVRLEEKYRSLIIGMLAMKAKRPPPKKGYTPYSLFLTLKEGLSSLVETLIEKSPDITFMRDSPIADVKKTATGYELAMGDGKTIATDALIVATPASVAAPLMDGLATDLADELRGFPYASTAAVVLAYRKEGFSHPLRGFGFVVPVREGIKITACTWVSSKFSGRAPQDHVLLRAFVGGALRENLAELAEDEILALVKAELKETMGVTETPVFTHVFKYPKGNVQYRVGHEEFVKSLYKKLEKHPGLFLAGSAYEGTGIPDCVRNGEKVACQAMSFLDVSKEVKPSEGSPSS